VSWEHSKYEARCQNCKKSGFCIRSSDDWGRSATRWIGFKNIPPSPTSVGRKRADQRDNDPKCSCGSGKVVIGKAIGECNFEGNLYKE
jgi:hypothetical protein